MTDLAQRIREGNRRAIARGLTAVENGEADDLLGALQSHTGNAYVIGVTGAPGTGKSTLVARLVGALRERGRTVAVLALDPTSPFSGGALLGDRVRMASLSGDRGVFIRSTATRGQVGGLALTTSGAIHLLDAAGFDIIIVETVGAGQSEIDIVATANTTIVVTAPGLGDGVQAIKAGILEIADVLVVNKADLPGAANTVRALQSGLEIGRPTKSVGHHGVALSPQDDPAASSGWVPHIVETVAIDGTGIPELLGCIDDHHTYLSDHQLIEAAHRGRIRAELEVRLRSALYKELIAALPSGALEDAAAQVAAGKGHIGSAVQALLAARNQNAPN